ncbi:hypothetical protein GCM10009067_08560 [Haloarcula sebkhae]|uniref:Uncharacterized protein n=1 Tax=Haloarcula sebkhae TaxID=932660 RepID=A0A830ELZ1_9EURY|nr:hypothetical protein GCM10009067_08560 [Haloarcula sebkhae]
MLFAGNVRHGVFAFHPSRYGGGFGDLVRRQVHRRVAYRRYLPGFGCKERDNLFAVLFDRL